MIFTPFTASLSVIAGGCLWGLYWMPLSHLERLGLQGASVGICLYIACLILLGPAIIRQWPLLITKWRALLVSGLLTGAAFSLFTTSLAYTDVIRAILLFYLTPVWGTLLGFVFLKEAITLARGLVILLALSGLFVILGDGTGLPMPRNLGDVLALLSGVFWAVGSLGLVRQQSVPAMAQIIAFLWGGLVVSLCTVFVISNANYTPNGLAIAKEFSAYFESLNLVYICLFSLLYAVYVIPMVWLTIAPARILTPARVGVLLMSEVLVGAASAALLSGQTFGLRELVGTGFVISAVLAEVYGIKQKTKEQL